MHCRQPEKNVLPLEFSAFLSLAVELSAFLAGEQVLITGPRLVLVDANLANQGGLAAGVKAQPLGYSAEREAILIEELNSLLVLL